MVPAARVAPLRDKLKIACIGPITAATLEKHGFKPPRNWAELEQTAQQLRERVANPWHWTR